MLGSRSLLLLVACVAALLLPALAGAATWPVMPVVTGGKITYSGGVSGSLHSTTQEGSTTDETSNLDFSQVSYAGDLYGGLTIFDDGGASSEVKTYTSIPGSGTVKAHYQQWDPITGELVWKDFTCSQTGKAILPPQPARVLGGKLNPGGGVGGLDFTTTSACSDAKKSGTVGSTIAGEMAAAAGTQAIAVGGTPPAGASKTFDLPLNGGGSCPPETGLTCTYNYSGEGHAKVECAVCLTSVELEQVHVKTGEMVDVPTTGTIDGNRVFATATFTNTSPYTIKSIVKWRERVGKRDLIDAGQSTEDGVTTFPAGQAKQVTFEWDTSGFAWEKGKPSSDRELEVRTGWGGGFVKVKVRPKPIVAVHGWAADHKGWDIAKQIIPGAIHPDLAGRVYAVGDDKGHGSMDTQPIVGQSIAYNAGQEAEYIKSVREDENAQHVDVVAHSMGGLISRYYIQKLMPAPFSDDRPTVAHLIMLGTPNMGSPCADLIGIAARGIPTDQLKPSFVEGVFNKEITDRRQVPFSVIAGDWNERTCTSPEHGDLVVAVGSAWWTIEDVAKTYAQHMELTDLESIYASFVKPRVGLDPDQAENVYQEVAGARPASARRTAAPAARAAAAPAPADVQAGVAETVTVPADGSVDVAIPVGAAAALSVGSTAGPGVSSALIAPGGATVDAVAAGTDAARSPMRFQRAASPAAGGWTLRLSQSGGSATEVAVVAAFEGSPLVLKAQRDGGRVTATLRDGGAAVTGASVTAELRSPGRPSRTLTLHDDGAGAYSATTDLPDGEWFGTVHATSSKGERFANLAATAATDPSGPGDPSDPGDPSEPGDLSDPGPSSPGPSAPAAGGGPAATPTGAGGASAAPAGAPKRTATVQVSLAAKRTRVRRAPYRFALSGRLSPGCPAGTKVLVAVTAGRKTVAKTTVSTTKRCTFSATVKVARRARLRATATVVPSADVTAAVSRPLALRAG